MCFGELTKHGVTGAQDNFHCWVEAKGWVLDFMAPAFPGLLSAETPLEPMMFQKRQIDMVPHINSLRSPGDFFLSPVDELTEERLKQFWEYPIYGDLADICVQWFIRHPKQIPKKIGILDNHGKQVAVSLSGPPVRGRW